MKNLFYGIGMFILLVLPPIKDLLESFMITHMLVQIPLLIVAGLLMGDDIMRKFPAFFDKWDGSGIPGIVLVYFVTMYWMIPRAMDEALLLPMVEVFKFISLPFLVGIPLRHSWMKLHEIGKGFIIFNYIPMFGMMAWLYIDSPIQICNNYLESEQKLLGWGFFLIMLFMLLYILQMVFIDHRTEEGK